MRTGSRGVRSGEVFVAPDDRREYLRLLREQCDRHGVWFLSYCLMTKPCPPHCGARKCGRSGARHRRGAQALHAIRELPRGCPGLSLPGWFFSCPLDERQLVAASQYIERNPVRAGLVAQVWEYPWSSAAYHVGGRDGPARGRARRGELIGERDWKALLEADPPETAFLRRSTHTARPCGDNRFAAARGVAHDVTCDQDPWKWRWNEYGYTDQAGQGRGRWVNRRGQSVGDHSGPSPARVV